MNMKKMLSLALAGVMALSLMACSAQNGGDSSENTSSPSSSQSGGETQNGGAPESVTITSLNANKEAAELEVPYDPQRIAILDMASLDILPTRRRRSWRCRMIPSVSPFWIWPRWTFWTPWAWATGW